MRTVLLRLVILVLAFGGWQGASAATPTGAIDELLVRSAADASPDAAVKTLEAAQAALTRIAGEARQRGEDPASLLSARTRMLVPLWERVCCWLLLLPLC